MNKNLDFIERSEPGAANIHIENNPGKNEIQGIRTFVISEFNSKNCVPKENLACPLQKYWLNIMTNTLIDFTAFVI